MSNPLPASPMPWEQARAVFASRARCAAALAYRAVSAGHLGAARKVRGRRTASNSRPIRLILCAAHTPWSSIRVHRYDYARGGARRRPRPNRARPRRRRCRPRRPRRCPSEPRERLHGQFLCVAGGCNGRQSGALPWVRLAARAGSGAAAAGLGPARRSPTATPAPALAPEKRARRPCRGLCVFSCFLR